MKQQLFTLEHGHWFALSMFPGYGEAPYHSPIRVDAVRPLSRGCLELGFLNLGYAAGVRDLTKRLRTLRRTATHIVLADIDVEDRTYLICALTKAWIRNCAPAIVLHSEGLFDARGAPSAEAFLRLGQ